MYYARFRFDPFTVLPVHILSHPQIIPGSHLAAIAHDDAPFLLEWVLHHRLIGFDRITVYGDGITEQASQLGRALASAGLIKFREGVAAPDSAPGVALAACLGDLLSRARRDGTEWLLPLGIEEFLLVEEGDGGLGALLGAVPPDAGLISLTWQIFGNAGHGDFSDRLVTRRFTRAAPVQQGRLVAPLGVKTLLRPHTAERLGRHRPMLAEGRHLWVNGAGQDVTEYYRDSRWFALADKPGFGHGRIAFYATRDNASWLVRAMNPAQRARGLTPADFRNLLTQHGRINVNRIDEDAMQPWAARIETGMAELLQSHPQLRQAQTDAVTDLSQRIADFSAGLEGNAREAVDLFLTGQDVPAELLEWETTGRVSHRVDSGKWRKLAEAHNAGRDDDELFLDADERPEFDKDDPDLVIKAPAWLADLRLSPHGRGFYHSIPGYALTHVHRSDDHLIVSFDNLSSVRDNPVDRDPWGYEFVRKSGWSHLGVMGYAGDWYRSGALMDELTRLRDQGLFAQYRHVTFMGTSMGAFAACAFAPLAPGCTVIAFSPQETLDPKLVPWENRFGSGRKANWTGRFSSADQGLEAAGQSWLFYDPCFAPDLRHAQRFTAPGAERLEMRLAGHKTALVLRAGGVLSRLVREIVGGSFSRADFPALYQPCRRTPAYLSEVAEKLAERGRTRLLRRYIRAIEAHDMTRLAKGLRRRHLQSGRKQAG